MINLNKIMLIGRLGKDAEGDDKMIRFSLATSQSSKKGDKWETKTTWHYITLFKPSDNLRSKLVKGAIAYVEGSLNSYEDKEGVTKYAVAANYATVEFKKANDDDMPF